MNTGLCPQTPSLTQHHVESQEPCPEGSEPLLPQAATGCVTLGRSLVTPLSFRVFVSKVWVIPSLPESLEVDLAF